MLTKEFGFNLVLSRIFYSQTESKYLDKNSVTEEGYQQIKSYLETTTDKLSIDLLGGILATFAYGHPKLVKGLNEKIEQLVLINKDLLFEELDEIYPEIKAHFNNQEYQNCLSLMKLTLSEKLIDYLSNLYFRGEVIFKENQFYSIQFLLLKLAKICPENFENWYGSTKREDLKVIYINSMLRVTDLSFEHIQNEKNINSKILITKVCYLLIKFNAGRWGLPYSDKTIKDLVLENSLSQKEKLYFILYSFRYRFFSDKDEEEAKLVSDDLKFFSNYFDELDSDFLKEFTSLDERILAQAIGHIKEDSKRNALLSILSDKLTTDLEKNDYLAINHILKANLHSAILVNLNDNSLNKITDSFDKRYKEITSPYFFYRKNKLWSDHIAKMMYELIIIFALCKSSNPEKVKLYKEKFSAINAISNHRMGLQFTEILKQIN